ncbi:hypothetical protein HDU93_000389, partial [Gonapodya sp. JEL0774]
MADSKRTVGLLLAHKAVAYLAWECDCSLLTPTTQLLIFGATGKQGGACITALMSLSPQTKFRIVTRDPTSPKATQLAANGVEVFKGDMTDTSTLQAAMKGIYGIFLVTDSFGKGGVEDEVKQGLTVIDAAFNAGIQYVVYSSVGGVTTAYGRAVPHFASKLKIEQHIKSKPWKEGFAILRPVAFFENVEMFGPLTLGKYESLLPADLKLQQIATKDIGEFAALAFTKPQLFSGKETEIAGDDISSIEMANILAQETEVPWSYSKIMPTW